MNVAVIGCGVMGSYHSRIYSKLKNVNLVGVCDTNLDAAKKLASLYKTKYYKCHTDLIKDNHIDAASITVPTINHYKVAMDFIKNNIPILIEKPITESSKTAKQLISTARDKGVFVMTGHIERFNPAVSKLYKLISQNKLGDILSINIKRVGLIPHRLISTNVITDLAVHDLDIASLLVGRLPHNLYACGSVGLIKDRLDHAEVLLDFGNFGCFIQANWITPIKVRQLSITGTKGYAELNYISQELVFYNSHYKTYKTNKFSEFVTEFGNPNYKKIKIEKEEPLKLEIKSFLDCILNKTKPLILPEDALSALYLAEAVERSIEQKKIINIW